VDQKTLFTFYSRAEAEAAVGPRRRELQRILEDRYPQVRFEWDNLWKAVREHLDVLPDTYDYDDRSRQRFEGGLRAFARELLLADPRTQPQGGAESTRLALAELRPAEDAWRNNTPGALARVNELRGAARAEALARGIEGR